MLVSTIHKRTSGIATCDSQILNRLNLKVSKLGRHAMRLKFYKIKNQQEKILHELKKVFNVKDSNDQDRIRYFSLQSTFLKQRDSCPKTYSSYASLNSCVVFFRVIVALFLGIFVPRLV